MAKNKNNPQNDQQSAMSNKQDSEFKVQGIDQEFDNQGQQAGSSGGSGGSAGMHDDEAVDTAGGRKGQFSDKDRSNQAKWSPGSSEPHNE